MLLNKLPQNLVASNNKQLLSQNVICPEFALSLGGPSGTKCTMKLQSSHWLWFWVPLKVQPAQDLLPNSFIWLLDMGPFDRLSLSVFTRQQQWSIWGVEERERNHGLLIPQRERRKSKSFDILILEVTPHQFFHILLLETSH